MFYETKHSVSGEPFKLQHNRNFSFPAHLHANFELIYVAEGEMKITVDNIEYNVSAGKSVLVFPYQVHSLATKGNSRECICIFSQRTVNSYSPVFMRFLPKSNLFTLPSFYAEALESFMVSPPSLISVKGFLYGVCACFDKRCEYVPRRRGKEGLAERIFDFVENNYSGKCDVKALAEHTSYHYVYLSQYFKQYTGISFTDYVNRHRVNEACYMLYESDKSILDIAMDCGFGSLRSFNRNFKQITGVTPGEYRAQR